MNSDEIREKWQAIQKRSFTNWINEVLRPTNEMVSDIFTELADGIILCKLAMLLTLQRIKYYRAPRLIFQRQSNVGKALHKLEEHGLNTIGVEADHVINGNEKMILGLVWQIVNHFHVFQSIKDVKKMNQSLKDEHLMGMTGQGNELTDTLHRAPDQRSRKDIKKHILADINRRIAHRGLEVENLATDWRDGDALLALVDYNVKGIYDLHHDSDPVQKVSQSMVAAFTFLGIPQLIEPADFCNSFIDEQTITMYITCFIRDEIDAISVDLYDQPPQKQDLLLEAEMDEKTAEIIQFIGERDNAKHEDAALHSVGNRVVGMQALARPHSHDHVAVKKTESTTSTSSEQDEGISADILNEYTPSHKVVNFASYGGGITKSSLEDTLPTTPEPEPQTAPLSAKSNVEEILDKEIDDLDKEVDATISAPDVVLEAGPPPDVVLEAGPPPDVAEAGPPPSPGEVSGMNQDDICELQADLNAAILTEISTNFDEKEDLDKKDFSSEEDFVNKELDIPSFSLEDAIPDVEVEVETPEVETPTGEVEIPPVQVDFEASTTQVESIEPPEVKVGSIDIEMTPPEHIYSVADESPEAEVWSIEASIEPPKAEVGSINIEMTPPAPIYSVVNKTKNSVEVAPAEVARVEVAGPPATIQLPAYTEDLESELNKLWNDNMEIKQIVNEVVDSESEAGFSGPSDKSGDEPELVAPIASDEPVTVTGLEKKHYTHSQESFSYPSAYTGTTRSNKSTISKGSVVISGGDEISSSVASGSAYGSVSALETFPVLTPKLSAVQAELEATVKGYSDAKEQFKKFIVKTDKDYRKISFERCCVEMRDLLKLADFSIVASGENVLFGENKQKKNRFKNKSTKKSNGPVDPILAQLPRSANLGVQGQKEASLERVSKKNTQRQKELANAQISLYTVIVQHFQHLKMLVSANPDLNKNKHTRDYTFMLDDIQEELMLSKMIFLGQCSPDH